MEGLGKVISEVWGNLRVKVAWFYPHLLGYSGFSTVVREINGERLDLSGQAIGDDIVHWSFSSLSISQRSWIENSVDWVVKTGKQRSYGLLCRGSVR